MTRYAVSFVLTHLLTVIAVGLVVRFLGIERSVVFSFVAVVAATTYVALKFAKTEKRLFSSSEQRTLTITCMAYLCVFDLLVLFARPDVTSKLSGPSLTAAVVLGLALDLAILWYCYGTMARKLMTKQLERQ